MISVMFISGPFGCSRLGRISFPEYMLPLAPSALKEQPALQVPVGWEYVGVLLCLHGRVLRVPMHSYRTSCRAALRCGRQ